MIELPALPIPIEIINRMTQMSAEGAQRLLVWIMRIHHGETIFLDQEDALHADLHSTIAEAADLLDPVALALGLIEIPLIASDEDKELLQSPAEEQIPAHDNIIPLRRYADGTPEIVQRTKGDHLRVVSAKKLAAIEGIVEQGVKQHIAEDMVERYSEKFGIDDVLSAILKMKGKGILNPQSYITSCLANLHRTPQEPEQLNAPKLVRRQTSPSRNGAWEFLGWTCENNRNAGPGRAGRRKVWRTDSGKLSYKLPDENETPPDFSEDPGVMEVE